MIVAAAQICSAPGDVAANIDVHLAATRLAARHAADMVIFPELSLTGYEPLLADQMAFALPDERLQIFHDLSTTLGITIGIGLPTRTEGKPRISLVFFRPNLEDILYSKQHLHEDEWPFFEAGDTQVILKSDNDTLVPAICYEALVPGHAAHAADLGATAYLACVAKSERGMTKAHSSLPEAARRHQFSVVVCNAVGRSDNFVSVGRSAAWNCRGERLACAGEKEPCLLLVNLASGETAIEPLQR